MNSDWKLVLLGDVCGLQNGFAFKSKLFKPTGMPVLRISSIQDEEICDHRPVFTDPNDYKEDLSRYVIGDGDLLIAMSGATTGKVGFNRTKKTFLLNQRVGKFEPTSKLDIDYLFYFLSTKVEENLAMSAGSAQPNLSTKQIKDFEIPLPSLPEQKRIVAILGEAFAAIDTAIANTEKNFANARELFESYLNKVFTQRGDGWVEKSLEKIGMTQTGSTPKTSVKENYGDFMSFVKPADFNADGSLDYQKAGLSKMGVTSARIVPAGSVLMVCIGATIGKCGYCDQDVTTNQQINALTPSDGSSHRFLYYQMLTERFQRSVTHGSGQATLPIINKSKWSALSVWLPPTVRDQQRIAITFDTLMTETQHLESIYQRKLGAIYRLKQSILQKVFSGELTANAVEDVLA